MKPRPSAVHLLQRASLLLADSVEKVCDITGRQRGNAGKWVDVAYWHFCDIGVEQRNVRFSNRPFGVKRFQTIHHLSVNVARGLVLLFGIGTKALPSWGFEDEVEQSFGRPRRQHDGRSKRTNDLTSSIVP